MANCRSIRAGIAIHPQNSTAPEGNNVTLSCATDGNRTPSISWTKDGSHISCELRISFGANNKEPIITNVGRADLQKYRCVASNSLRNATSNTARLDVQCKHSG